jgi:oxepin-CoA hydrolase / 3-oxo-5,6-dehydrosuberyl-CoA semialdehyde dehydrogenase
MVRMLRSYAAGAWHEATDDGAELTDASTGAPVGRVSSAGLDIGGMVEYARAVGGPALAELTFTERAAQLKQLALYLNDRRDDTYYPLSACTGATGFDSKFDVDGGIGVLFGYSSRGRRELPDDVVFCDGPPEPQSKDGSFVAQHIYTSRRGVGVFINAFNFPVWGMLEKFAPAFLAGLPVIVKPASVTAYLTEAVFADMVTSGLLPEGSVQLLCGSVGDLMDHLGGQDAVAFTGSADTAARLRAHPSVVAQSVRFTAEADSLNCAILGPDAEPGTPEFDLYVREVVREMTVKAGQKCTAIRRALVPNGAVDAVVEALQERLTKVVVGDPRAEDTTMGPLASLAQRDEVQRSVKALSDAAELVVGGTVPDGPGAFFPPTVLDASDSGAEALHTVEAFGPVSSVIGYRDVADAVRLACLGGGSLVGSLVSHDPDTVRTVLRGVAPFHGRLLVLDRDDARSSTGHGSPTPMLVHGGPGRAGGGEELGGLRGVAHFMQRTAVQGPPTMVAAVTGRWTPGAPQLTDDVHPFRKYLEDLRIGETLVTASRTVTLEDIERFADLSGDTFYAHMDAEAAAANLLFGARVAHGYFVVAAAAGLFVDPAPGPVLANYGLDNLRFLTPVYPGDTLTVTLTCKDKKARQTEDYGEVRWDVRITNQEDAQVAAYDVLTLVAKRPA